MEPPVLGVVLDSSVLIAAERRKLTAVEAIESIQKLIGEVPVALSVVTIAEVGHGIYRAITLDVRERRRLFLDELKATVPIYPVTEATAEIVARIGGEQAAKGITLTLGDLMIGACALELGYSIGTSNQRDFNRIPGLNVISILAAPFPLSRSSAVVLATKGEAAPLLRKIRKLNHKKWTTASTEEGRGTSVAPQISAHWEVAQYATDVTSRSNAGVLSFRLITLQPPHSPATFSQAILLLVC
jgi:tRNA(fMet)-specific endonuclease VapC